MGKRLTGRGIRVGLCSILLCVTYGPTTYEAQTAPFDAAIDVQHFDLAPGSRTFLAVPDGNLANKRQLSLDFLITYLTEPFVLFRVEDDKFTEQQTEVVSSMLAGQLVGAYGLTPDLQLAATIPLAFSVSGDGIDPNTGQMATGGLSTRGLGDVRMEVKGRILQSEALNGAWFAGLTIPTSFGTDGHDYLGDDLPAARGGAAMHWTDSSGKIRIGSTLGLILRKPRTIYAAEMGQQVTYGAAASYRVTKAFSVMADLFGRSNLTAPTHTDTASLEADAGFRIQATRAVHLMAGGGAGLIDGIGSPGLRFVFAVGYAPDFGDNDGDGISNMNDRCPNLPEDMDQFEDTDGCPDRDNDGDRRDDEEDKCPNSKEDIDGFEDEDGCPEPDNDKDGFLDAQDQCPMDAEDKRPPYDKDGCPANMRDSDDDGVSDLDDKCPDEQEDQDSFDDGDGCPDVDNDKDGISDEVDQCPLCPEDADGFNDDDGCPDVDNDEDGVLDDKDSCPNEKETLNGFRDDDGCPDSGGRLVAELSDNRLLIHVPIRFSNANELRLTQDVQRVAKIMKATTSVRTWRIVVAAKAKGTESETRAASQAQADSLRDSLVQLGLAPDSIEAIGAVSDQPTVVIAVLQRQDGPEYLCTAPLTVQSAAEID